MSQELLTADEFIKASEKLARQLKAMKAGIGKMKFLKERRTVCEMVVRPEEQNRAMVQVNFVANRVW